MVTEYRSLNRVLFALAEITEQKTSVMRVTGETFKAFLLQGHVDEFLNDYYLLEDPGYYGGEYLSGSLALLDEKPRGVRHLSRLRRRVWYAERRG